MKKKTEIIVNSRAHKRRALTKDQVMAEAGGDTNKALDIVSERFAELLWDY